jgi:hypothetical protein
VVILSSFLKLYSGESLLSIQSQFSASWFCWSCVRRRDGMPFPLWWNAVSSVLPLQSTQL